MRASLDTNVTVYTVEETARLLRISRSAAYEAVRRGQPRHRTNPDAGWSNTRLPKPPPTGFLPAPHACTRGISGCLWGLRKGWNRNRDARGDNGS